MDKYEPGRSASALTYLERKIRDIFNSSPKTVTIAELVAATGASQERCLRAVGFLTYRYKLAKADAHGHRKS